MTRPTEAMERLRRVKAGEHVGDVYAGLWTRHMKPMECHDRDRKALADYLLDRIPRERPEQMCDPGDAERPRGWRVADYKAWQDCCCDDCFNGLSGVKRYEQESDAIRALIHDHWNAIDSLAERLDELTKQAQESEVAG